MRARRRRTGAVGSDRARVAWERLLGGGAVVCTASDSRGAYPGAGAQVVGVCKPLGPTDPFKRTFFAGRRNLSGSSALWIERKALEARPKGAF